MADEGVTDKLMGQLRVNIMINRIPRTIETIEIEIDIY